jgi:DNA-binding CsgD family transcriptional regulator
MTEMSAISSSPLSPEPSHGALDVVCAEPLLRAPLVACLERDGHDVTVHEGDLAPSGQWAPTAAAAVVVFPASVIDAVRHGWLSFVGSMLGQSSMVLVACAANVPAPLLGNGGPGRDHGFIVLDRDSLGADWPDLISASVLRAKDGAREIASTMRLAPSGATGLDSLTTNERTILRLLAEGLSNAAIAEFQFVGERTVESHIRRIYAKLELSDTPGVQRRVLATRLYLGGLRPLSVAD